jgi:hypothetical protein
MPQQRFDQTIIAQPQPAQPREAEWHTTRTASGKGELAITIAFCILIAVGLIYAASLIGWKAAAIAGIGGPAIPFLILIWRSFNLLHTTIDRELAEHFSVITQHNQASEINELQIQHMRAALLPPPEKPIQINTPWSAEDRTPFVVLPDGERVRAADMMQWAASGNLTIENARLNGIERAEWEGACDWLSGHGFATVTSQGKTGKLTASADVIRKAITQAAVPWGAIKNQDPRRYGSTEEG